MQSFIIRRSIGTKMMGNVDMNAPAPPGYSALRETEGYIALSGTYFWAKDTLGDFTYCFHSDNRHGNLNGVLHGAAIVTFVDTILGHTVVATTGQRCATIALDSQFVAAIRTGEWIDGRTRTPQAHQDAGLPRCGSKLR